MYSCKVCHSAYTPAQAAALEGACKCGQGLSDSNGIGWKHLNPKTPIFPKLVVPIPKPREPIPVQTKEIEPAVNPKGEKIVNETDSRRR